MRIFVAGGVPKSLIGFRGALLSKMVELDHEVIASASSWDDDVVRRLNDIGVTYKKIPLDRNGVNPFDDINTMLSYKEILTQLRIDCALFYTIKPVIYGSFAATSIGIPNICSMITGLGYAFGNDTMKQKCIGNLVSKLYRKALRCNKAVLFQNPDDLSYFIINRIIKESQAVLINGSGVNLDHYTVAPPVTEHIVFLLIARLIRDKGIYEFVEAARYIKSQYPQVRFQILGSYDSNPTAIDKRSMEEWCNDGIVEYLGVTNDVRPYIANASVYVLPSYREGTPRTVLEAMSMGRPVITTNAPGCRETVVDSVNGYLVPVKSIQPLAMALERFILKPELIEQMGIESRKIAEEKYDVKKVNMMILQAMNIV